MTRHFLFLLTAIFTLASAYAGDFDYGAYKPSSLVGATAEHRNNPAVDFQIEAGNFKESMGSDSIDPASSKHTALLDHACAARRET